MEYTYGNLSKYFRQYLRPYWGRFAFGSVLRFVGAILGLYSAYALAQVITFVTKHQPGDTLVPLYTIFVLWTASFLIRFVLYYYSKMLCMFVGEQASLDIEKNSLRHLSLLDISWHEKENSGNKVKRIQRGSDGISKLANVWIQNVIDIIVSFVGAFIIISQFDLTLAGLIVLYQIIYYVIASTFRRRTTIASRRKNIKEEGSTGLMFEIMSNIRSIKVLGMSAPLLSSVQKVNDELAGLVRENLFWQHMGMLIRTSWQNVARVLFLAFIVWGIFAGRYELGFMILFWGYFNTLSDSVNDLANVAQDVVIAKTDVGRLAELFDQPITIDTEEGKMDFPKEWDGIHVRNLSFSYGNGSVFSGLSFDIKKGEKIGIVGLSGAGKSTLFKLLLKEYESSHDDILIGEIPLRKIKKSDYVQHVAAVLQETEAFNMSLRKNITIANIALAENEQSFKKAIHISHVDDFVHKLPEGVDTLIGEKGVKLSGGEKQRLGIARAVFKNPEILFLDEATSHLDVESEQKIQDSLQHFFKDVTAVVIAHRLSTIKEMDRIIVIQEGKILETGTFDELYEHDGRFREFWDKQQM
jgi:ABC-type multidrug transport system fused ATPase/permease subunit